MKYKNALTCHTRTGQLFNLLFDAIRQLMMRDKKNHLTLLPYVGSMAEQILNDTG